MTNDTLQNEQLRKECESLLDGLDATYHDIAFGGTIDDVIVKYRCDVAKILAFARAQQAKGLREAVAYCHQVDGATHPIDLGYALEAQATALENKKGVEPKPYPLKDE